VAWDAVAGLRGTVVLLMAVKNLPAIAARLVAGGRPPGTPVAIVSEGTMPGERTLVSTLASVEDDMHREQVRPPAIVVIGEVVAVAKHG
jgi:uroporphyrin-III C-methyltransferase/precorrin-2 dehydrogenase/sirohydrochlorin ferrochelatase